MAPPPPKVPPELDGTPIPRHIAIIMDGNGRWAREKGWKRVRGHEQGAEVAREVVRTCAKIGVERLTLYAFSYENWERPKLEVEALMRLLKRYLIEERGELESNGIRFTSIGRVERLPEAVRREMDQTTRMSAGNRGMTLCLALSYGGRVEILDAARRLAEDARAGRVDPAKLDEDSFRGYLYDPAAPDPDLLIRTGGEMRVSNFLLWQISYTELYVTPVLWPEFGREPLFEAIREYGRRERRFGRLARWDR